MIVIMLIQVCTNLGPIAYGTLYLVVQHLKVGGNTGRLTRASSWFCFPQLPIAKISIVSQWLYVLLVVYIKGIDTSICIYMAFTVVIIEQKNNVQKVRFLCLITPWYFVVFRSDLEWWEELHIQLYSLYASFHFVFVVRTF